MRRGPRWLPRAGALSLALGLLAFGLAWRLAQRRPQELRLGYSTQGRPLTVRRYGQAPDNVTVVVFGCHGDERGPLVVGQRLREHLDAQRRAYDGAEVWLVLELNPDGCAAGTRVNGRGVDLNRNFPSGWSTVARAPRYNPGSGPLTEPETRAALDLLVRSRPQKVISVHCPLGGIYFRGAGGTWLAGLFDSAHLAPLADRLPPTPGSFGDHCTDALHLASVTIELPDQDGEAGWTLLREGLLRAIRTRRP